MFGYLDVQIGLVGIMLVKRDALPKDFLPGCIFAEKALSNDFMIELSLS